MRRQAKPLLATFAAYALALSATSHAAPVAAPGPAPGPAPAAAPGPAPAAGQPQTPPVQDEPALGLPSRRVELGVDTGAVSRPSGGAGVHYALGWTVGGHARVEVLPWLAARVTGRVETQPASPDRALLGLPAGTEIDQPGLHRVYVGASAEPTWSPLARLDLWAGIGVGWGRTLAPPLHTSGAETIVLPTRSAVFLEVPLSLGARYEVVPSRVVANLSGAVGALADQSGKLLDAYRTPGQGGKLVTIPGFPEFGTSWVVLAGLGVLL